MLDDEETSKQYAETYDQTSRRCGTHSAYCLLLTADHLRILRSQMNDETVR